MDIMSAHIEGTTTFVDTEQDRRPLEVEVETLGKYLSILDDQLHRLSDRLQPILSDRGVLAGADRIASAEEVDNRSPHVRTLGTLTSQVERLAERVESLYQRVDC